MNTLQTIDQIESWNEHYIFSTLINCFLKEHTCWHRFFHTPLYDEALAAYMNESGNRKLLKIKHTDSSLEIYCPVRYYSPSGRHSFNFPIISRDTTTEVISEIGIAEFVAFIETINGQKDTVLARRIEDSRCNSLTVLKEAISSGTIKIFNKANQSFIESEQSLVLGHQMHPVAKSRLGFTKEELLKYSPECRQEFQLHYFLVNPELVDERSTRELLPSSQYKDQLLNSTGTSEEVKEIVHRTKYKTIPVHPWEANYLLKDPDVKQLIVSGDIKYIGEAGPLYTPTSSVRTLYSEASPFMLKFSLHVKITNSERINLERELHRGYDISRLLKTSWGENLAKEFPEIEFVSDPGFSSVRNRAGELIEGFNTVVRNNPFTGVHSGRNVSLIASLSQDGILQENSRLTQIISQLADNLDITIEEASRKWFARYLRVTIVPLVAIYNKYGLACEAHQQNVLIEMDQLGFPVKLLFRDNQGYFFREGKAEMLTALVPDIAAMSMSIVPEDMIHPKYTYYILYNNILGIVNAFGTNKLIDEYVLFDILVDELQKLKVADDTGFVEYLLNSRDWYLKGNMLTTLQNMDEARQPIENPAVYVDYPNPLLYKFFCKNLIKPETNDVLFTRYFSKHDIAVTVRPFSPEQHLTMLHGWFNQEHTKAFWKMDGPIRQLEEFYIMLMSADHSHSFIGEVNGEPTFTIEPYWPMRDTVGKYYEADPSDYGAHLLISPVDKNRKFTMELGQVVMEFIFRQPVVGKCIGEADVNAKPMHMLVTRLGFKFQKVLNMPHKNANLTFCEREWYLEKFPDAEILSDNRLQVVDGK